LKPKTNTLELVLCLLNNRLTALSVNAVTVLLSVLEQYCKNRTINETLKSKPQRNTSSFGREMRYPSEVPQKYEVCGCIYIGVKGLW
jgi:hypothetical protein